MSNDPCFLPPGRAWEIENCLAEIPGPQWDRYTRTGKFAPGIQKGLDDTAACHTNIDVYVKEGSSDRFVRGANIVGIFPPGWYKRCQPEAPPPPPPSATVTAFERTIRIDPMVGRLGGVSATLSPVTGCRIVSVPTLDLLVPLPAVATMMMVYHENARTPRMVMAGELGNAVVRVPGSDHQAFSTGYGFTYIAREFLSAKGRAEFDWWDLCRERWCTPYQFQGGREVVYATPLWGDGHPARSMQDSVREWTKFYSASHMQCLPRNCYPNGVSDVGGVFARLGVAGDLVPWRWRSGGAVPILGDAYGEARGTGFDAARNRVLDTSTLIFTPSGLRPDGLPWWTDAPEAPLGFRDEWDIARRTRIASDLWRGPAPGTFAAA